MVHAEQRTLASLYERLIKKRNPFLERGRAAACLTIPSILPPEGSNAGTDLEVPYQSLGARGVNTLSNRLLLTLLPPSVPFFRLTSAEDIQDVLAEEGLEESVDEIDESLGKIEQRVMRSIEKDASRIAVFTAFKSLVTTGNSCLFLPKDGGAKVFRLDQYVVVRDHMGHILQVIVKEMVSPLAVSSEVRQAVADADKVGATPTEEDLALYTTLKRQERDGKDDPIRWSMWQEVGSGVKVPGSEGDLKENDSPFIVLRMTAQAGEDYGRGLVEELFGDLYSLEKLSQAIVEASAAAARVVWLNKPNGNTRSRDIEQAPNGSVRTGDADDISALKLDKTMDLRVAQATVQELKRDLGAAFLLKDSIQRAGERVTATEIREMIKSLEDALGGVFALLAQEFQLPLVLRTLAKLDISLPEGVDPAVITGLDALGRNEDLNRLDIFIGGAQQAFGPDLTGQYIRIDGYLRRRATALGIDQEGLVRSQEDVEKGQQQQQQAALIQSAAPAIVKAGADLLGPQ